MLIMHSPTIYILIHLNNKIFLNDIIDQHDKSQIQTFIILNQLSLKLSIHLNL